MANDDIIFPHPSGVAALLNLYVINHLLGGAQKILKIDGTLIADSAANVPDAAIPIYDTIRAGLYRAPFPANAEDGQYLPVIYQRTGVVATNGDALLGVLDPIDRTLGLHTWAFGAIKDASGFVYVNVGALNDVTLTNAAASNLVNFWHNGGVGIVGFNFGTLAARVNADVNSRATNAGVAALISTEHGVGAYNLSGGSGSSAGSGARAVTVTVTDGALPIANATVRVTLGANSYYNTTDAVGVALFSLDDGTYTVSVTKGGYGFTPALFTVAIGAVDFLAEMTQIAIPPQADPSMSSVYLVTRDGSGAAEAGVKVYFRALALSGDTNGHSLPGRPFTRTSDLAGLLSFGLPRSSRYEGSRDGRKWTMFDVPDAGTFELPNVIGQAVGPDD